MKLTYKVDPEEINNIQNPNVKAFFKELVEATAKTAKTCDYDVTVGATTVQIMDERGNEVNYTLSKIKIEK